MKLKAKVEVNGKEIEMDIEVSEEELAKLQEENRKDTGYGYGHLNALHYVVLGDDYVSLVNNSDWAQKMQAYDKACNLYHDETLAANNARADKLMRQLRRFAAEHNQNKLDWHELQSPKYTIQYDCTGTGDLYVQVWYGTKFGGGVYFDSKETTQLAIDTFYNELIWYFTLYDIIK